MLAHCLPTPVDEPEAHDLHGAEGDLGLVLPVDDEVVAWWGVMWCGSCGLIGVDFCLDVLIYIYINICIMMST